MKDTEGGTIQYVYQRIASEMLYKNRLVLKFDEANILVLLVFDFVVFIAGLCFLFALVILFCLFWGSDYIFLFSVYPPHSVPTFILLFVSLDFCSVVDSFFSSLFFLLFVLVNFR